MAQTRGAFDLGRLITAVVTPFDAEGRIDWKLFDTLLDRQFSGGVDGVCLCGTTGEGPSLSVAEKLAIFARAQALFSGRGSIMANVGSYNTRASIELARQAAELDVDAVMAVVPYYYKPSQRGIYEHFKAIANAVPSTQVVIYNIPGRCIVGIENQTMLDLMASCPNVRAMKQADCDLESTRELLAKAPSDFACLSGNDEKGVELMQLGGRGIISTASNVAPGQMAALVAAAARGDWSGAQALHKDLLPLMLGLFKAPNPTLPKEALRLLGYGTGALRLPLVPADAEESATLASVLRGLDL